jgi:hypothetical protein
VVAILLIALVILALVGRGAGLSVDFTKTFVLVIIIFAALFLITAGYSDQQAAPVYGILGTILGYLFGRTDRPAAGGDTTETQQTAATGTTGTTPGQGG